ncbi:YcxB family protein [Dyella sp. GSA-30]|uniref:YcxB family protein n=1 Tax=Dyella sp. GSA-30 TaxID=2994496 RepID=UPI0024912E25|nr:YcxB family protein [Dyella sp. GSA-30]
MNDVISVTAKRTFAGSFIVVTQLWFTTPSGYLSIAFITALIAYVFYDQRYPWFAVIGGLVWVAFMLPLIFAIQAWKIRQWSRSTGQPVFSFDEESATCKSGLVVTRVPWSGIKQIKFTRKTCFFYLTKQAAWFFGRNELSKQQESAILSFARRSNVKLTGKAAT